MESFILIMLAFGFSSFPCFLGGLIPFSYSLNIYQESIRVNR